MILETSTVTCAFVEAGAKEENLILVVWELLELNNRSRGLLSEQASKYPVLWAPWMGCGQYVTPVGQLWEMDCMFLVPVAGLIFQASPYPHQEAVA